MIISYRTLAFIPRPSSGLEPDRFTFHHTCNKCLRVVLTEELFDHTMDRANAFGQNGIPSDPHDDSFSEYVTPSAPIITKGGDLRGKAL